MTDLELVLIVRHLLAFGRDAHLDHLSADAGSDDVGLAHVSDAEEEAELSVALANDGVAAEEQRLRPHLGPRQFGEDHAHHERLDHDADDALDAHDEDGFRTLFRRVASAVADRMLRFDAEQEAGREAVDVGNAGLPSGTPLVVYSKWKTNRN